MRVEKNVQFFLFFVCLNYSCRIAQNLPELPLSAHLLAPIQRLCRYPLHLSELVKFTPAKQEILKQQPSLIDIPKSEAEMIDCKETLELALGAMKRVTEMVNEGTKLCYTVCAKIIGLPTNHLHFQENVTANTCSAFNLASKTSKGRQSVYTAPVYFYNPTPFT